MRSWERLCVVFLYMCGYTRSEVGDEQVKKFRRCSGDHRWHSNCAIVPWHMSSHWRFPMRPINAKSRSKCFMQFLQSGRGLEVPPFSVPGLEGAAPMCGPLFRLILLGSEDCSCQVRASRLSIYFLCRGEGGRNQCLDEATSGCWRVISMALGCDLTSGLYGRPRIIQQGISG